MILPDVIISGSVEKQVEYLAKSLGINYNFMQGKLYVWTKEEDFPEAVVNTIDFEHDLIGYPTFWDCGIRFRGLFNPTIIPGNIIKVNSIVPGVMAEDGTAREYLLMSKSSTLSTLPNGQWVSDYNCFYLG